MTVYQWLLTFFETHGVVFELLICIILFTIHQSKRPNYCLGLLIVAAVFLGTSLLFGLFPFSLLGVNLLKYAMLFGITIWFVLTVSGASFSTALFTSVSIILCQHAAYKLSEMITFPIRPGFPFADFIYVLVEGFTYAAVYLLFARKIKLDNAQMKHRPINLILYTFIALFIFVLSFIFDKRTEHINYTWYYTYSLMDMTCCVFAMYNQYSLFYSNQLELDKRLLEQTLHQQATQYQKTKDSIELFNMKYHDLKKLLAQQSALTAEERHSIYSSLSVYDIPVKTGNETLDIILAEKNTICQQYNIRMECIADGRCFQSIGPADAYSLFGNAIDNALESNQKIQNVSKRYISLSIHSAIGFDVFHIENPYIGELHFENGLPVTTKGDKAYHGYGIKSIEYMAKKYGGYLTITMDNQIFSLNIIIPVQCDDDSQQ